MNTTKKELFEKKIKEISNIITSQNFDEQNDMIEIVSGGQLLLSKGGKSKGGIIFTNSRQQISANDYEIKNIGNKPLYFIASIPPNNNSLFINSESCYDKIELNNNYKKYLSISIAIIIILIIVIIYLYKNSVLNQSQ